MNFKIIIFVIAAVIFQISSALEINVKNLRQTRDTKSVKKQGDNVDKRGWWWWGSPYVIEDEHRAKREALEIPLVKLPKLGAQFRSARNVKPNSKNDMPDKFKKSGAPRRSGANTTPSKRGWCWWCWWWW